MEDDRENPVPSQFVKGRGGGVIIKIRFQWASADKTAKLLQCCFTVRY